MRLRRESQARSQWLIACMRCGAPAVRIAPAPSGLPAATRSRHPLGTAPAAFPRPDSAFLEHLFGERQRLFDHRQARLVVRATGIETSPHPAHTASSSSVILRELGGSLLSSAGTPRSAETPAPGSGHAVLQPPGLAQCQLCQHIVKIVATQRRQAFTASTSNAFSSRRTRDTSNVPPPKSYTSTDSGSCTPALRWPNSTAAADGSSPARTRGNRPA